MKTERLYVKNVYLKEAEMTLVGLEVTGDKARMAFDKTVFFPTGGGQLCDGGFIGDAEVLDVKEDKESGVVWHYVSSEAAKCFEEGRTYTGKLDWEKRFNHMQLHCGEHILSGCFKKLFNADNKGFHMGEDYVTIDIALPGGYLTKEQYKQAEKMANEAVFADIPVETIFFDTAEEAVSMPVRKEIKFGEDISVVIIGPKDDPVDCCACCGTHPGTTGQIGIIKITHCEKYKGMNRFYVKCGKTALDHYDMVQEASDSLARKYSCGIGELEATLDKDAAKNDEVYRKFASLKAFYLNLEADRIREDFKTEKAQSIRLYNYSQFSADDLQTLARNLEKDIKELCIFAAVSENSCMIASSGEPNCGKIVKDNAGVFGGKGGGKNNLARAIFTKTEDMQLFIDSVEKLFRCS